MNGSIYKYTLELKDDQPIVMPKTAKILTAQAQNGRITMWAIVDTTEVTGYRIFEIYGTGFKFDPNCMKTRNYIATVQMNGLVWHIFELLQNL